MKKHLIVSGTVLLFVITGLAAAAQDAAVEDPVVARLAARRAAEEAGRPLPPTPPPAPKALTPAADAAAAATDAASAGGTNSAADADEQAEIARVTAARALARKADLAALAAAPATVTKASLQDIIHKNIFDPNREPYDPLVPQGGAIAAPVAQPVVQSFTLRGVAEDVGKGLLAFFVGDGAPQVYPLTRVKGDMVGDFQIKDISFSNKTVTLFDTKFSTRPTNVVATTRGRVGGGGGVRGGMRGGGVRGGAIVSGAGTNASASIAAGASTNASDIAIAGDTTPTNAGDTTSTNASDTASSADTNSASDTVVTTIAPGDTAASGIAAIAGGRGGFGGRGMRTTNAAVFTRVNSGNTPANVALTNAEVVLEVLQGLTRTGQGAWTRYTYEPTYPVQVARAPTIADVPQIDPLFSMGLPTITMGPGGTFTITQDPGVNTGFANRNGGRRNGAGGRNGGATTGGFGNGAGGGPAGGGGPGGRGGRGGRGGGGGAGGGTGAIGGGAAAGVAAAPAAAPDPSVLAALQARRAAEQ